jgi:hypothetical protein
MAMVLRVFGPYGIIFGNICVFVNVAKVMMLRDFGIYV